MRSNRVLILKLGQIGDAIMVIPAAYELHKQGFTVDWVCGKAIKPLLDCYSWINVIPVDDHAIFLGKPWARARAIAHLWRQVVPRRYDLCATLYYDRRFRLLSFPIRARRKVSLLRGSRDSSLLPGRRQPDEFIRVLSCGEDGYREKSAPLVRPDLLPPSPLGPHRAPKRIAVIPGGTRNILGEQSLRRWPIESYLELIDDLLARNWEVVVMGGPDDKWVCDHLGSRRVTNCVARFSLAEVISACEDCDAVICHDTGPLHLAGLSRTCLVGIFGPTDPSVFMPRRPNAVAIWGGLGLACRPCYDGREFAPCTFNGCMHQVRPQLVLEEMDRLIEGEKAGRSIPWRILFS